MKIRDESSGELKSWIRSARTLRELVYEVMS